MPGIARIDVGAVCSSARSRLKALGAVLLCIAPLTGCAVFTWFDTSSGSTARDYCKTFADDVESCIAGNQTAADAIANTYKTVSYCCIGAGNKCTLPKPKPDGFDCSCPTYTPYGAHNVPGRACK